MIINKISEIGELPIPAYIAELAAKFVKEHDLATLPCGRYELTGDSYVNVDESETRPQLGSRMEFHKKYADIQCIIRGHERFLVTAMEAGTITTPYSEERDIGFIEADQYNTFDITDGLFIYFEPGEPHGPCFATSKGVCKCKKAVFKIRIN
ncbi:MAG: YhcH/YjgK/YiaL family protein [Clostridia bacterium]|nr:YhcH/YjgK/YiaL family protein [Clostridia bacterium]